MKLDAKIPAGNLADKWQQHCFNSKLVNPANKRKYTIIVVGSGLAGASAAATLGELGYNVNCFFLRVHNCGDMFLDRYIFNSSYSIILQKHFTTIMAADTNWCICQVNNIVLLINYKIHIQTKYIKYIKYKPKSINYNKLLYTI